LFKEIYKTLKREERVRLISISFFTLISLFLEIFGITLIIPISKLIFDPEFYGQLINDYSNLPVIQDVGREKLIIFITTLFFLTIFFKTIFFSILSYKKFSFINDLIKNRTIELYDVYLNQNITFFKETHSASLVKNLINEMLVLSALFNSTIILFSELIFTLLIVFALCVFNFPIFIFLLGYSLIIFKIFKKIFKNRILSWGNERQVLQADITKDFMESFGAIKELIVYNRVDLF
jgi:ABC-type multidrug transport system fused ATPase/permease subunit